MSDGKVNLHYAGKWIAIGSLKDDKLQTEYIYRTTKHKFFAGVNVFAVQEPSADRKYPRVHLIENFRIPVWQKVLEVPAGLAEIGTTLEENARREVAEEIGVKPG